MRLCHKPIASRSRFKELAKHRCHREEGHAEKCAEFPFLVHLKAVKPQVAKKIIRDATMTTGAAWGSEDAGPNRIRRWVMLLSDAALLRFGINMSRYKPQVVAKLREKAAQYEACVEVAQKLSWLAYSMKDAPPPPQDIRAYLENLFGTIQEGSATCQVCLEPLGFSSFAAAKRGKAEIETAHANPRLHTAANVGFAHRDCNIAQGAKSLDEFYAWIAGILERVKRAQKDVTGR